MDHFHLQNHNFSDLEKRFRFFFVLWGLVIFLINIVLVKKEKKSELIKQTTKTSDKKYHKIQKNRSRNLNN